MALEIALQFLVLDIRNGEAESRGTEDKPILRFSPSPFLCSLFNCPTDCQCFC